MERVTADVAAARQTAGSAGPAYSAREPRHRWTTGIASRGADLPLVTPQPSPHAARREHDSATIRAVPSPASPSVSVVVLGTVQDGGVPHPCCECPRCAAASKPGAPRRYQASVAVVGQTGRV